MFNLFRSLSITLAACLILSSLNPVLAQQNQGQKQPKPGDHAAYALPASPPSQGSNAKDAPPKPCIGYEQGDLSCDAITAQASYKQARDADWQVWVGIAQAVGLVVSLIFSALATRAAFSAVREAEKGAEANREAVAKMREANEINREILIAQGRARLIVEAELADGIVITGDSPEIRTQVKISVTNIGEAPAINMSVAMKFIVGINLDLSEIKMDISQRQKAIHEIGYSPNVMILPNQSFIQNWEIGTGPDSLEDNRKANVELTKEIVSPGEIFPIILPLYVIGCAQYRLPGSAVLHQTGFAWEVEKILPDGGWGGIDDRNIPLQRENLRLALTRCGPGLID